MSEESEQLSLCKYIKLQYKDAIFNSDHSGIRVSPGLANKIKSLHSVNGIPDLNIDEARGGFFGLKIELKATGKSPYKKDGSLKKDDHLETQAELLKKLSKKGYLAKFCTGFDEAKELVDFYMNLPETKQETFLENHIS
jgi:hypothetical protein